MGTTTTSAHAKIIVLITLIILGSCLGNLSQTAVNAMNTAIAAEFSIDLSLSQWMTTIYMLVLGVTVPITTYLMKRFTFKQVAMLSLGLLLVGCLLDWVAWDFPSFIVGRVIQAISAGIAMPMMTTVVMITFPPGRQATVMGIAGIAMGFAPNIGPTIGGLMVSLAGWRSLFVLLTAIAAVLVLLGVILIEPGGQRSRDAKLDHISFWLSTLGFGALLLGFSNASSMPLTDPFVWVPVLVGAVGLVAFVARQNRVGNPLISMKIFDAPRYGASFWILNFLFISFLGITLLLPLFVENTCGGTPFEAGFALFPATVAALIVNPLAGILTDKLDARRVTLVSGTCLFVGSLAMAFMTADTPYWLILLLQGIRATGVSGLIGPVTQWGLSRVPSEIMADGSSFSTAVRQALAAMGTAAMIFIVTTGQGFGMDLLGYQLAFGFSAVFATLTYVGIIWKLK